MLFRTLAQSIDLDKIKIVCVFKITISMESWANDDNFSRINFWWYEMNDGCYEKYRDLLMILILRYWIATKCSDSQLNIHGTVNEILCDMNLPKVNKENLITFILDNFMSPNIETFSKWISIRVESMNFTQMCTVDSNQFIRCKNYERNVSSLTKWPNKARKCNAMSECSLERQSTQKIFINKLKWAMRPNTTCTLRTYGLSWRHRWNEYLLATIICLGRTHEFLAMMLIALTAPFWQKYLALHATHMISHNNIEIIIQTLNKSFGLLCFGSRFEFSLTKFMHKWTAIVWELICTSTHSSMFSIHLQNIPNRTGTFLEKLLHLLWPQQTSDFCIFTVCQTHTMTGVYSNPTSNSCAWWSLLM